METFFTKLLEKISHYEILNNLIPGSALCFILSYIGFPILDYNVWAGIVICYLVGIVNSRFSSVFIEPICRKTHIIQWRDYKLYNKAKKERPFIASLLESANMFRSFVSVFFISLCAYGIMLLSIKWVWLAQNGLWLLLLALMVLFVLAYRKQINKYVVKNIDEIINNTPDKTKE